MDAFRKLPESLGARLVLIGEGPLREQIEQLGSKDCDQAISIADRVARWLAGADIYVPEWPTRHSAYRSSKPRLRASCRRGKSRSNDRPGDRHGRAPGAGRRFRGYGPEYLPCGTAMSGR